MQLQLHVRMYVRMHSAAVQRNAQRCNQVIAGSHSKQSLPSNDPDAHASARGADLHRWRRHAPACHDCGRGSGGNGPLLRHLEHGLVKHIAHKPAGAPHSWPFPLRPFPLRLFPLRPIPLRRSRLGRSRLGRSHSGRSCVHARVGRQPRKLVAQRRVEGRGHAHAHEDGL
jgi:hypothetical protein